MFPLFGYYVTIDTDLIAGVKTYITNLFSDLGLVIVLVIGLPLAFWAIRRVIGLVRAR